jgi:transcriptional regulator PpsR
MKAFKSPRKSLVGLAPDTLAAVVVSSSDVALVLDRKGTIRDVAFGSDDLAEVLGNGWVGKPLAEVVGVDSRGKVDAMLQGYAAGQMRPRQVNHPARDGSQVPVSYATVALGDDGRLLALGRDLRPVATLQQRLIQAEQSLERDYSRLRHAETRYRLLFQVASEPVLIVDATTQRVVDANPAAAQLLGEGARRLVGRAFPEGFDALSTQSLNELLATVRATGRAEELRVRLAQGERSFLVSASLFRQDNTSHVLLRLSPLRGDTALAHVVSDHSRLAEIMERLPDAVVVTAPDGRILTANRAFLDLVQLATDEQARNESIDRWLGRPGVDLGVLIANLKQHGTVRLFATTLRGEYGAAADVEISAVAVPDGPTPCIGFTIRDVGRRRAGEPRALRELPRSVEQLTELVGRVSLKELVRETTDVIERLCIEAALDLTRDNRASAAEMLGLSRQSLYVKLRRYGLGDLESQGGEGVAD